MVNETIVRRRPGSVLDIGAGDGSWLAQLAGALPAALLVGAVRDAGMVIETLDRTAGTAMLAGPRFSTPAFELVAVRR